MALELEGLIARVLLVISCAGEEGLPISDFKDAAKLALHLSDGAAGAFHNTHDATHEVPRFSFSDHAVAAIWKWLVRRTDISIGPDRRYNHLTFLEVLALDKIHDGHGIRIHASQETMWEAITGHAVDYKRVPRSEWLLLLGIASTKAHGILQGDLGRLVDQDKRSVPKRTDALVKKGYITKRTTLVRGTKTSKMWLKLFAPPLPKDGSAATEPEAEMNLSRQVLAISLDAVPWHTRWTGESVDYTALATTIMAVCKEWGVLRMQDLKSKLGVLGMRWQMKVVSKVCRFLNARDAIRYVAAKLDNKVFNDCVQFNRDLTPKDWSIFLATGKRAGKPARTGEPYNQESLDAADTVMEPIASSKCLSVAPTWSADQPLAIAIAKSIMACGDTGLTNPDIYGLTLGVSFTRFLSSLTTCLSTPNIQPVRLQHLQVISEHSRTGKVASYRYSLPPIPHATDWVLQADTLPAATGLHDGETQISIRLPYGFDQEPSTGASKLVNLSQATLSQRKQRGRPRKIRPEYQNDRSGDGEIRQTSEVEADSEADGQSHPITMMVKLQVPSDILKKLMEPEMVDPTTDNHTGDTLPGATVSSPHTSFVPTGSTQSAGRERGGAGAGAGGGAGGRGGRRGRGRGRGSRSLGDGKGTRTTNADATKTKGWKCDQCGKTWKNDIGLKYHLEKSQTPCNPSFSPADLDVSRREARSALRPTSAAKSTDDVNATPALGTRASSRKTKAKTVEDKRDAGRRERDCEEYSFSRLSPTGVRYNGGEYPLHTISRTTPSLKKKEGFALNSSYVPQSAPGNRDVLKLSGVPHEQVGLLQVDMRPPTQIFDFMNRDYPADHLETLPYAVLEADEIQKDSSPVLPSEGVSAQGDQGEHRESFSAAVTTASHTGKASTDTVNGHQTYDSATGDREMPARNRKPLRNEITDQISTLLLDMLMERNGVLPGGHSLWHAITAVWNQRYPDKPVPKTKDFQWALSRMLKARSVLEHWHGFQDQSGLFSKCQILTLPHLDAFSAETLAIVEKIKQRHPQLFIPSPFQSLNNQIEYREKRENRRGRRVLAGEVAQLDAPVYAAQSSSKRHHGVMSEATPGKRRKFAQASTKTLSCAPLSAPLDDEYRAKWASNSWLSEKGAVTLDRNKDNGPRNTRDVELQFLAPNSFLEDDWCAADRGVSRIATPSFDVTRTNAPLQGSPTAQGVQFAMAKPVRCIVGQGGSWPYLGLPFFEEKSNNASFTLCGWMPDMEWFSWAEMVQNLDKRFSANESESPNPVVSAEVAYANFMQCLVDCLDMELNRAERFINAPPLAAGPYSIFVNLSAGTEAVGSFPSLEWHHQDHLTPLSFDKSVFTSEALISGSDEESDFGSDTSVSGFSKRPLGVGESAQSKVKRVALITRPLTSISRRATDRKEGTTASETADGQPTGQAHLLAAFVVVRVLLGGADKAIDWGVLLHIFPNARLASLRKFWAIACKEQGAYIKKFTRDVQQRLIEALESQELPMVDFEDPTDYDWETLIKWASRISRQEGYQIPRTRELLAHRFSLLTSKTDEQDWCERYFHAQSSIFSRFEAVTSEPGALSLDREYDANAGKADVARSWIKSLCCTSEAKYSVRKIREKFLTLSGAEGTGQGSLLLKQAIDQLTAERVICRSKKTPLGGRPYRLSEWYLSTLNRVAQHSKYEEAAAFKRRMDAVFRTQEAFEVPYTLDDGSTMALTNLNAAARITIVPVDIPNVPLGFEPGNYESRKYPKSYYHFRLRAVPTESYQFSEDIAVLQAVVQEDLPSTTPRGEIPQWIDFFGEKDSRRWSDILGAFCFAYATKGPMTVREICNSLRPILDDFEAQLIIDWGLKTGVFEEAMGGVCVTVGEWWWLAVPWQYSR